MIDGLTLVAMLGMFVLGFAVGLFIGAEEQ